MGYNSGKTWGFSTLTNTSIPSEGRAATFPGGECCLCSPSHAQVWLPAFHCTDTKVPQEILSLDR